jgi:phosphohistidine swiveling domain-containing protein
MSTLSKLGEKTWVFDVSRRFNWFVEYTQILTNTSKTLQETLGFDCSAKNYLILNGDEYYQDDDLARINKVFEKAYRKDQQFFKNLGSKIEKITDDIINYTEVLSKSEYDYTTTRELLVRLMDFQQKYILSFVPSWSRPDLFLENKFRQLIKEKLHLSESEIDEVFTKIATYPADTPLSYQNEPLELLTIAERVKKKNASLGALPVEIERQLQDHMEKYAWMKGPTAIELLYFTEDDYKERLKELLKKDVSFEISRIKNIRNQNDSEFQKVVKKYKFDNELVAFSKTIREFIYLRTFTTEISDKLFYTARKTILNECAKRLRLFNVEIVQLTSDEIGIALQNEGLNYDQLITERDSGFAIIWNDGEIQSLFGDKAIELQEKFEMKNLRNEQMVNQITGRVASKGLVQGYVKIVLSFEDASSVSEGDILVASMTTPDFIAGMEKAAGFVTDEGGITCHAAIIAREFGVPCIVGTGIATKVLKDGNLVEVDANKGIVRILK